MGRYADPTEKAIRCPLKGHQRPLLACLACRHFPCRAMTEERLTLLRTSPFVQLDTKNSKLLPRRHVMYIFRMTSGELRDAPEDFSPDAPDFEQLADVEEVLVIGKVLVKQLRLVAKPGKSATASGNSSPRPTFPRKWKKKSPAADAAAASGTRTDVFGDCIRAVPFYFSLADFPFGDAGQLFPSPGSASPVRLLAPLLPCPGMLPLTAIFCGVRHCQDTRPPGP